MRTGTNVRSEWGHAPKRVMTILLSVVMLALVIIPTGVLADSDYTGIDPGMTSKSSISPLSGEPVELTSLKIMDSTANPATFSTMTSNTGGLKVVGEVLINDTTGAGAVATIKLTPRDATYTAADGNTYFNGMKYFSTIPTTINVTPAMGAGTASIDPSTGVITVTIPFTGGAPNSTHNFTIVFPFDHATFDARVANGTPLADVDISINKGTGTNSTSTMTGSVKSSATDSASLSPEVVSSSSSSPSLDLVFKPQAKAIIANITQWNVDPGSTATVTCTFPAGVTVSNANGGTVVGNTITWVLGPVNTTSSGGPNIALMNNSTVEKGKISAPQFIFPSSDFSVGENVSLNWSMSYTSWGEATATIINKTQNFVLRAVGTMPHLGNFTFSYDNGTPNQAPRVNIDNPEQITACYRYSITPGTYDSLISDIPDMVFTWNNSADEKKVRLYSVVAVRDFSLVIHAKYKIELTISTPGGELSTVEQYFGNNTTNSNSSINIASLYDAAAGEYISSFKLWPLNNPNDTVAALNNGTATPVYMLPGGAGNNMTFELRFQSWPSKTYPGGQTINDGDFGIPSAKLTWADEVLPGGFTDIDDDPDTTTIAIPASPSPDRQRVYFYKDAPFPSISVVNNQGGAHQTGETMNATLSFYNTAQYATGAWNNPVIYVLPPSVAELASGQTPHVFSPTGVDLGEVTIEGPLTNGVYVGYYKLTLPSMTIPRTSMYTNPRFYTIDLTYKIKAGAPVGSYKLGAPGSGTGENAYPGRAGRLFGSSVNSNCYFPSLGNYMTDTDDLDGNPNTKYLRGTESANSTFSVISSNSLDPSADLLTDKGNDPVDPTDDTWENIDLNTSAEATVPLEGTGQFKLTLTNKGNTYVGDIRLFDILPFVGNTGAMSDSDLGSAWAATLQSMAVTIKDKDGNDITNQFWTGAAPIRYCSSGDPSYSGGPTGALITHVGSPAFSNNATVATAKSFDFIMPTGKRLPPGATIEFLGTVQAPAGATASQIGLTAYNSFAATGAYYDAATGGTSSQMAGPFEPNKQAFVLADGPTAAMINTNGLVYRDVNGNDKYDSGIDLPLEGVKVKLMKSVGKGADDTWGTADDDWQQAVYALDVDPDGTADSGDEIAAGTDYIVDTDSNGGFGFEKLYSGWYRFEVVKPANPTSGGTYAFDTQGDDAAATDSHVNTDGVSNAIFLDPGQQKTITRNAGIKANKELKVEYRENTTTGTLLKSIPTSGWASTTYQATGTAYTSQDVTVVADSSGYAIPADYHLVTAADGTTGKTATYEWTNDTVKLRNTIVFAVEKDKYTLSFDVNGVSVGHTDGEITNHPSDQTLPWDSLATEPSPASTLTGYTFKEWNSKVDGTGTAWDFANDKMPKSNVTLYAVWTPIPYTVTFAPGANGAFAAQTTNGLHYGDSTPAAPSTPGKPGWAFAGWDKTITATITGDATYTATWTKINYTVSYAAGGSNVSGLPSSATKTVGDNYTVSSKVPTRTGYTFNYWIATSGISGKYESSGTFTMPAANVVLTASWTKIPETPDVYYSLSYEDGGDNVTGLPVGAELKKGDSYTISLSIPQREGYKFLGWVMTSGGSGNYVGGDSITMPASDVVLTASWDTDTTIDTPLDEEIDDPKPPETTSGKPDIVKAARDAGIPILPGDVPLISPKHFDSWSLLDLILTVIGVILFLVMLINYLHRKKRDEDGFAYSEGSNSEDKEKTKKKRLRFVILGLVAAVIGVILFVLTQDVTLPMVLVDEWTIVFAILFVIELILSNLVSKRVNKDEEDYADMEAI